MTEIATPTCESAETLRKDKKYAEASAQFAEVWQQNPSPYVGWRYAFCLRKVGQLNEAERVAREALSKYPEDRFTKTELGWILYERELKPAKVAKDLWRTINVANQVLKLSPDGLTLSRVALAVMKVSKERGKWEVLMEWADRLDPANLDNQPGIFDGKRGMSDRETWYVGRSHALLELERFDEARQCAQAGLVEFPDEIFLRRTAALALAGSGDVAGSVREMRSLLSHRRVEWYMRAELADLEYQMRNYGDAYRLICEALASCRQEDKYKLGHLVTLARVAVALGKLDVAAEHVSLTKAIRSSQGWPIPRELIEVERGLQRAIQSLGVTLPVLPQDVALLARLCRQRWHEGKTEGVEFHRGVVKLYPEDRHFAYIKRDDDGDDVYVLVRDLPRRCNQPGSHVEFALKTSYDKKKERESVQATNVRCGGQQ